MVPKTNSKGSNQPWAFQPPIKHQKEQVVWAFTSSYKLEVPCHSLKYQHQTISVLIQGDVNGVGLQCTQSLNATKSLSMQIMIQKENLKIGTQMKQQNSRFAFDNIRCFDHSVNTLIDALASKLNTTKNTPRIKCIAKSFRWMVWGKVKAKSNFLLKYSWNLAMSQFIHATWYFRKCIKQAMASPSVAAWTEAISA